MSVNITPVETSAATAPAAKPQLEIQCYPFGVNIVSGARQYFFPYKTIHFLQLERHVDASGTLTWILHIRTEKDKINLTSARDLEADFKVLMMTYKC